MDETMKKLQAPFPPEDIEFRVQSCGMSGDRPWVMVLAYVQARAIQRRLDDVFGWDGWTDEYRSIENNMICRLGVKTEKAWIYKENGASETQVEAFKGGISNAFKRVAASGFGIGRYLYRLAEAYAECTLTYTAGWEKAKTKDGKTMIYWKIPQLPAWALPEGYSYPPAPTGNNPPKTTTAKATAPATSTTTGKIAGICADCSTPDKPIELEADVVKWCQGHAEKFKGKLLCKACQKKPDYK